MADMSDEVTAGGGSGPLSSADDAEEDKVLAGPAVLPDKGDSREGADGDDSEDDDLVSSAPKKRPRVLDAAVPKRSTKDKALLASAAQKQLKAIRAEQSRAQKIRLRFLLGQSEIFKHFIDQLDGSLPDAPMLPAATLTSPTSAGAGTVGAEIGDALLLSPMRAHQKGAGDAASLPPSSPAGPAVSVRRTRLASAAAAAGAPEATAAPAAAKARKRTRKGA
jgi:hypothetical protein